MSDAELHAVGPPVSGLLSVDPNIMMAVEALELGRLVPHFYDAEGEGIRAFLRARDPGIEPMDVTYTLPEVISVWFESYTGAEPALAFGEFIKGVGAFALLVEPVQLELVKEMVRLLAGRVAEGSDLPRIDSALAKELRECLIVILNNNEPMSWRNLMAFALGSFWLLGFIVEPRAKLGGRRTQTSVEFVTEAVKHYGELGYLPQ